MFQGSSPFSDYVDTTFLVIVGASLLVLLGILTAMVTFIVRYSRKKNPRASNIEGNIPLEITWSVVPLVLFMGMFYMGWRGYLAERITPADAHPITVTGRMWAWSFEYPNGVIADTLYVPVGAPIQLKLHSLDVNHSFFVPAFRIKKDVIPNRENTMWFRAERMASFDVMCAEYCGLNHSYMYTKVVARDTASFEAWYRAASLKQTKSYQPLTAGVAIP